MQTLYSILNAKTKLWWYHAQLRSQGNAIEARKRERESIRGDLEVLRNALYCQVSDGAYSVKYLTQYGSVGSLSGYGNEFNSGTVQACIHLGIPTVKTANCALSDILAADRYIPSWELDRDNYMTVFNALAAIDGAVVLNTEV